MEGTPFGRYRLVELLGRGGMGEVWKAYDTAIDRVVALKLLPANFADDPVFQERFRREAKAAAGLDEPHVVPIHDYGEIDGRLYVTMRLIKGRDLQQVLAGGPLEPERAVRIIEQVAQAVNAAHKAGLVHRDIKPSNILLDDNDFAYLIDFGIARAAGETGLTSTGATIGTWAYMSPERLNTGRADARADIYALACVLYEALTGQRPYPGDSLEQQIVGHLTAPPPRPSAVQPGLPEPVDAVIAKGMAKDPDQRYASTVELARAAHDATTLPLARQMPILPVQPPPQPGHVPAGPIPGRYDPRFSASAAPAQQPPPPPPWEPQQPWATPAPKGPAWRPRLVIPAVVAVALLIGGGVFVAVKVAHPHNHNQTRIAPPGTAPPSTAPPGTAAPNTGPFTGTYTANFDAETDPDGQPRAGAAPATETWGIRSVCSSSGCVATASRRSGQTTFVSTLVFDDVGGHWMAVGLGSRTCITPHSYEAWEVFILQPHPNGTFAGEYTTVTSNSCGRKRAVTFTRTGDVDVTSLPDPAGQPPRVVSPAEALHGSYHETVTFADGQKEDYDMVVRTDCLRTGDRCMSFFHSPDSFAPLVFGAGKWTFNRESDEPCPAGGTSHVTDAVEYPLPQPPQDPITLLTGHGRQEETGSPCVSSDYDDKYVRTGD